MLLLRHCSFMEWNQGSSICLEKKKHIFKPHLFVTNFFGVNFCIFFFSPWICCSCSMRDGRFLARLYLILIMYVRLLLSYLFLMRNNSFCILKNKQLDLVFSLCLVTLIDFPWFIECTVKILTFCLDAADLYNATGTIEVSKALLCLNILASCEAILTFDSFCLFL